MLWAATISVSHIDSMMDQSDVVVAMEKACCPDQGNSGHEGKSVPHNCCMAHCLSMKLSGANAVIATLEHEPLPVLFVYESGVVPNQFLQGLFRPPRTLA